MAFFVYNLILLALSPLIAVFVLYRIFVSRKSRKSWTQQLGFSRIPSDPNRKRIWVHAVSVGESVASASVVSEIKQMLPDHNLLLSTTTETGQAMAIKSVKDADGFLYYPFDLLPCVVLALRRIRPVLFASTDTEIWPNFRYAARMLGVKNAIINGTVSDKTVSGAKKVPWLYRKTLSNIDLFCMQSKADADRITALGADPEKVIVTGNCKADQSVEPMSAVEKENVRLWFGLHAEAKVFVAGSTNPGEDEPVVDAFIKALNTHKSLKLIIAPRQIERKQEIRSIAESKGLKCSFRSDNNASGDEDVFVLDTFGELAKVYGIADVTFVGGSLIPKGCHSILQPIAQGKPVLFGPYTFKAKDLVAQAKAAGVGFEIKDSDELAGLISEFLENSDRLAEVEKNCCKMMGDNLGASKRTAEALVKLLSTVAKKTNVS